MVQINAHSALVILGFSTYVHANILRRATPSDLVASAATTTTIHLPNQVDDLPKTLDATTATTTSTQLSEPALTPAVGNKILLAAPKILEASGDHWSTTTQGLESSPATNTELSSPALTPAVGANIRLAGLKNLGSATTTTTTELSSPTMNPAANLTVGNECVSNEQCKTGCCNFTTNKCAGRDVANAFETLQGCTFADGSRDFRRSNGVLVGLPSSGETPGETLGGALPETPGKTPTDTAPIGTQFITGPCQRDADCASGCCNFVTGLCAARAVAINLGGKEPGQGCNFGGAAPDFTKPIFKRSTHGGWRA